MTDTKITILSRSNTHVNKVSRDSVSSNTTNQLKGTDLPKNYDRTCDAPALSVLKQVPGHADNSVVKEKLKAKASTVPTAPVDRFNENSALKCKSGSRQDIQFASFVDNASNECVSQKTERRASCSNQGVGSKTAEERAEKPIERYMPPTKLVRDEGNAFCEKSVRFDLTSDVSDSVRRTDISKSSITENQKKKVPTGVFPTPRDEDFPALPSFGNRKKLLVEDSSAKAPIPKRRPVGEGAFAKTSNTYFRNMPEETNLDKKKPEQCEPNKDKHCHTTEKPIRPRLTLGGPYTNLFTVDSPSICLGRDGCGLCANFTIEIDEAFPDRGTYASRDSEDDDTPADSDEDRNSDEWSDGDGCDQFPLPRLPSPGINTPGNTKPDSAHPQHNAPDSRTEHSSVSKSASLEGDFLGSKHSVRHLYRGQDIANTGPGESNIDRGKDGHHQNLKNKRGDSTGSWADQTEEPQNEDCSGADGLGKLRQFLAEHDVGGAKDKQNTVPGGDARDVEDYLFRVSQSPSTSRP
ncbi:hypothetical protein EGW08_005468 [Elysia chlorotica]|uniref:Uncharacterized protein n=1 Tax=Elysia chlorotica TaxID=188477 RepID=A0A3S1HV86_ELYCH|nr:hypothetical protein EGW08_005468 [Elysia chlorotica]